MIWATTLAKALLVDANGVVYIAGSFGSATLFSGATSPLTRVNVFGNTTDLFVASYLGAGFNLQWLKSAGCDDGDDSGNGMAALGNEVFVAGNYFQKATFAPMPTLLSALSTGGDGSMDMFLAKHGLLPNLSPMLAEEDNFMDMVETANKVEMWEEDVVQTVTVTVFPNPTKNVIHIQSNFLEAGEVNFLLTDLTGQTVMKTVLNGETTTLSIEQLPDGMYLYRVLSGGQEVGNGKLMIVH